MDCMNSSESSHSSSGGEDECDSHADQGFSSFSHLGPTYNPPPPPSQHNHHHTTTTTNINLSNFPSSSTSSFMYDPLFSSTFLDPSSLLLNTAQNNSSVLLSTYSHDQAHGQLKDQGGRHPHFSPLMMLPNEGTTHAISRQLSNDASTINNTNTNKNIDADNNNDNNNINNSSTTNSSSNNNLAVRNPKKRSRASRRAPTTVLTTDTSNFRAMVQEFTGIPAPPFAAAVAASSFNRTRSLDLFGGSSTPHPYLLRPFAQRSHTIPNYLSTTAPPSSSSLSIFTNPVMSNTNPLSSINNNNNSSNSMNYQLESSLPSHLGLLKNQPLNLLSMSQIMQSQSSSLIHDLPKYPLGNASTIFPSSKPSGSSSLLDHISTTPSDPSMKMGGLGTEFGLDSHHHHHPTGGFRDEADGTTPTTNWDGRLGSKNNVDDQGLLRSISGSFGNFQRVSSEDKRIDESNGSTRSESMVEPWLRSSSSG